MADSGRLIEAAAQSQAYWREGRTFPPSPAAQVGGILLLVVFAAGVCLFNLHRGPAMGDHECIVAAAARQALDSGHILLPQINEDARVRKTPLGIWLAAASSRLLGGRGEAAVTEFTARLPSALAGVANALLVCWLGRMLYGHRAGLVGGFVMAGCGATFVYARIAQVDMTLTALTTLSYACFWRGAMHERASRRAMVPFYLAFALAMMAKAPLPAATVGLPLAVFWFVVLPLLDAAEPAGAEARGVLHRLAVGVVERFRALPALWLVPGTLLFLVVAGAWPLYIWLRVPGVLELWRTEYLDRASGALSERTQPWYYYLPLLPAMTAPFMLSLPEALTAVFSRWYRPYRRGLAYALTWALVGTVFVSVAAFKRPHYLLSMIPGWCLLLAPVIDRLFFGPFAVLLPAPTVARLARSVPVCLAVVLTAGGVFLRMRHPEWFWPYVVVGAIALVAWSAAGLTYAAGWRGLSFAALLAGVLGITTTVWPMLHTRIGPDAESMALAGQLRAHGLADAPELYWVGGRPNAALEYYGRVSLRRLVNEREMAALRRGRARLTEEVLQEHGRRIIALLGGDKPAFLVMRTGEYGLFEHRTGLQARVVFRLEGLCDKPGDELLVITGPLQAASRPASHPENRSTSRPDSSPTAETQPS